MVSVGAIVLRYSPLFSFRLEIAISTIFCGIRIVRPQLICMQQEFSEHSGAG